MRESWEFGSNFSPSAMESRSSASASGSQGSRKKTMRIAAPAMDKARGELGLASDPAGKRLADNALYDDDARLSWRIPPLLRSHRPAAFASR